MVVRWKVVSVLEGNIWLGLDNRPGVLGPGDLTVSLNPAARAVIVGPVQVWVFGREVRPRLREERVVVSVPLGALGAVLAERDVGPRGLSPSRLAKVTPLMSANAYVPCQKPVLASHGSPWITGVGQKHKLVAGREGRGSS